MPGSVASADLEPIGKAINDAGRSLANSSYPLKDARNATRGLADCFSDESGNNAQIEKAINAVGAGLEPARAHYQRAMELLRQAEAELNSMPDLVGWDETLSDAKFAVEVLGADSEYIGSRFSGLDAMMDAMGVEQAAFILKYSAAKGLLEDLSTLQATPLWKFFDPERVDALRPQLQVHVDAARSVVDGYSGLLANRVAVSDMFPELEMPESMRGLALKPFLEKAAEGVAQPGQNLVDDNPKGLPDNIMALANAVGQVPVDWSDRWGVLGFRGDGLLQKVIRAIEMLAPRLAPGAIIMREK
jgi:hypothetical protein